jgi:hypothetical protein
MPQSSQDEYVCFGIDIPGDQVKRFITSISPAIDNETITHHMLFFSAPSSVSSTPFSCGSFAPQDWKLMYGWGPGTPAHVLPDNVGFPVPAGDTAHFAVQMHYNNLQGLVGETDRSGVELCLTSEPKEFDADIMAIGGTDFTLPANSASTVECSFAVEGQIASFLPDIRVFQVWPHMHKLGTALSSTITRADGSQVSLGDSPNYSFDYQIAYPTDPNVALVTDNDTVTTVCKYNNNTPNDVGFGENTGNEMCFNFLAYYPKIEFGLWNWIAPAEFAQCTTTVD